tara:strand:+ start:1226 stop:2377 length:1152 start_codon:yes stop_codon:yes gene_type:complete
MNSIKEFNLLDVRKNSQIVNTLNKVYKLWGYEKVSPSMINNINILKNSGVLNQDELVSLVSDKSLCLRPEMTTSIVKLISTRLINKKRPIRLWNNGAIFEKKEGIKNSKRFNERIQSGIELIGYDTQFPEIEVINILFDSIDKLNLKKECKLVFLVSSTTIMDLILEKYQENNYEDIKKSMVTFDQDKLNKLDIPLKEKEILNDLLYTRGEPDFVLKKLSKLYGNKKVLNDLIYLFNTISPIAKKFKIQIQLDPTFQPHLNLYEGMVFQLICKHKGEKSIIAKGGRYDELVRFFNPKEKVPTGLGFSISIDNLRKIIKEENKINNKVLLLYKNEEDLPKALEEQKLMHQNGIITILEINPCQNISNSEYLMQENNCSEIKWIN